MLTDEFGCFWIENGVAIGMEVSILSIKGGKNFFAQELLESLVCHLILQ